MKPVSRAKLAAYKRHWSIIASIQDELSRQYIHEKLKLADVTADSQLAPATVSRFFHRGKGGGKTGYSLFRGPATTTLIGICSALEMDLKLQPRKPNGKVKP